jgi:hypothetical protein
LVIKRDATDSTAGGGAFDDIVAILSAYDLTGPLIANGMLQTNAQLALNQANDIILGNIVATKSACGACYTIPATFSFTTPSSLVEWGMSYTSGGSATIDATNPANNLTAYTLTAGNGTSKTVSIGELRGLLSRATGF